MEVNTRHIEQLIVGTKHVAVQEKLLEKGDALASLDAALDIIARTYEATKARVAQLQATPATAEVVHDVGTRKPKRQDDSCTGCGLNHGDTGKCPAHGHKCGKCGRTNHWARFCKTKRSGRSGTPHHQRGRSASSSRPSGDRRTRVDKVTDDLETLVFQTVSLDSINDDQKERMQAFVTLSLSIVKDKRPTALKAKVDTGAQANILPLRIYQQMDLPENSLKPSPTTLVSCTGTPIPQHGICSLSCTFKGETKVTDIFVTEAPGPAIIGLPSLAEFGIVTLRNCEIAKELPRIKDTADLIWQYPECFQGIGKFDGQYHIIVDPAVPPVVHPPRRVPFKMKEIKQELSEMEQQGIITPVREGEPTALVNSLVYHRKPSGKIRVCLDPKDLNKAIHARPSRHSDARRHPATLQGCKVLLHCRCQVRILERGVR